MPPRLMPTMPGPPLSEMRHDVGNSVGFANA